MTLARESVWRWILTEWTLFIYLLFDDVKDKFVEYVL